MIHLKCTFVHYSNLNSSSINKPFLNYGPLNMLFLFFFRFLIYVYFNEAFVKKVMKQLSFFNANFQNSFRDAVCYKVLGCQTLVILKWHHFENKAKFEKRPLFFRSKIGIFDIFFKRKF